MTDRAILMGADMDVDDLEPRKVALQLRDLEPLSIKELHEYITVLETEIGRVKAAIDSKRDIRSGAESLFRK